MRKKLKTFLLGVCAGIAIGISGLMYLSVSNKIIASLLFTTGLMTVITQGLNLYTGKIGYLVKVKEKKAYSKDLVIIWLGNFLGAWIVAEAYRLTRFSQGIMGRAVEVSMPKSEDGFLSILILAILCGVLMYIAVEGYSVTKSPIIIFLCISVFILSGFEHCVANMFFFSMAGMLSGKILLSIVVMTIGNSLGAMIIPLIQDIRE